MWMKRFKSVIGNWPGGLSISQRLKEEEQRSGRKNRQSSRIKVGNKLRHLAPFARFLPDQLQVSQQPYQDSSYSRMQRATDNSRSTDDCVQMTRFEKEIAKTPMGWISLSFACIFRWLTYLVSNFSARENAAAISALVFSRTFHSFIDRTRLCHKDRNTDRPCKLGRILPAHLRDFVPVLQL